MRTYVMRRDSEKMQTKQRLRHCCTAGSALMGHLVLSDLLTSSRGHPQSPALSFQYQIENAGAFCWTSRLSFLISAAAQDFAASPQLSPSSPAWREPASAAWHGDPFQPLQKMPCVSCLTWWAGSWRNWSGRRVRGCWASDDGEEEALRSALVQKKVMCCRKSNRNSETQNSEFLQMWAKQLQTGKLSMNKATLQTTRTESTGKLN